MMGNLGEKVRLGQTDLTVGQLGLASSYGGPAQLFLEAFEGGCTFFYWGALRRCGMRNAMRELIGAGKRNEMVIALQSFVRWRGMLERRLRAGLRALGTDYADVLLLGWVNKEPAEWYFEEAMELRERGLCRYIGISTHQRKMVPIWAQRGVADIYLIRYNFVHPGAEQDIFPHLPTPRPGIVAFRTTNRGRYRKRLRPDGSAVGIVDCYRFAVSHESVDVVVTSAGSVERMRENLGMLELDPMTAEEMEELRGVGG